MTESLCIRPPVRPCPVCCGGPVEVLHQQRFTLPEGHLLEGGYDVVSCDICGFVYADTHAKQADYDRFYAELSIYESTVSSGSGHSVQDQMRLQETAETVARILPSREARILDFGCAGGGLLRALQSLGYRNLFGVDPSPTCAMQANGTPGITVELGSLFNIPAGLGEFDCILLTHVLEHVEDVRGALANLMSLLRPGGMLYLEVPNASRYPDFILAPFQDFNTEHINHFSARSLDNACGAIGLKLVQQGEKVFETAPRMPFPATYGFWRKDEPLGPRAPLFDAELRARIKDYIRRSSGIMSGYDAQIKALTASHPELVVWGTGQLTLKLLTETALGEANIAAFVDGNPINQGKTIRGVPILAPDELAGWDKPILVASTIHFEAISANARQKLGNEVEVFGLE